jgi:hypothetical protein
MENSKVFCHFSESELIIFDQLPERKLITCRDLISIFLIPTLKMTLWITKCELESETTHADNFTFNFSWHYKHNLYLRKIDKMLYERSK